ncbi:phosphoribosylglycinamide formyltransferase [Ornithobacterium rhinotracheale]|uniref:phosphoribosylglycinamide formyltransferase n=1 Tax=Ornithobacterium rhinotracheale TaxID=28251 RepID=UPI00129CC2BD|nr:phosphoribosylglycinamide formyltransferase [Ornithobacterium rhinotracheale]MRJ08115.1 phosphoribosylglycinamide formyltransferase [Ornithobacterium rhinotracheale]MRJ10615.1 phosphoribosylglycinamide formyltransferase [Ornithobacterium rhinotracheale]UOH78378.1 phosphoribosylglycinamide formyltransferase [Ornithobacterium rhinotracheale]
MKIAVLVSGSGSNLQAIIDAVQQERLTDVEIACVIADRNCYAMERALEAEIPTWFVDKKEEDINQAIDEICKENSVDLIVLAGFLSILNKNFCQKWDKKIINLHPSLLPKFGGKGMHGMHVHKAVIAAGETESGASVHYVTAEIDEGEVIAQMRFDIPAGSDVAFVAGKIAEIEKPLLISVIDKLSKKY